MGYFHQNQNLLLTLNGFQLFFGVSSVDLIQVNAGCEIAYYTQNCCILQEVLLSMIKGILLQQDIADMVLFTLLLVHYYLL